MRAQFMAAVAVLAMHVSSVSLAEESKGRYSLGPQDRVVIRVHSLRRSTGETYAWTPLNSEFTIAADGSISLPIVGITRATGITAAELAETIANTLKVAANLAEVPSASVEIVRHRPFYVTGSVQQPGKYEFEPGMTVLKALSTASGLARASNNANIEREMMVSGGDLRILEAERIALDARLARLATEIAGSATIVFPDALLARRADARATAAMQDETLRFDARRGAVKAEIDAIEQSKVLLSQELKSLEDKGRSLDRQIEINKRELRLVSDLVARGLTVTPRQLAAESAQAAIESNRLDVQVAYLRAQQSLARSERDIIEVRTRYRKEALDEIGTVRLAIEQNSEKARTAENLMQESESRSPALRTDADESAPVYTLTRTTANGSKTWTAGEEAELEPGDVLRVSLPRQIRSSVVTR